MKVSVRHFLRAHRHLVLELLILVVTTLLIADSFGNPESVAKLIGIPSYRAVIPTLALFCCYRWLKGTFLSGWLSRALLGLGIISGIIATVLPLYDFLTFTNASYSLTRLNQDRVGLLAIFLGLLLLINQPYSWWHTHRTRVLTLLPFVAFYALFLTSLFPFDLFAQIIKEDQLIEYTQFWLLLAGGVAAAVRSWQLLRGRQYILAAMLAVCAAGFLVIAGDEISWGQRIVGVPVSDTFKELNRQEELNLHNLYAVEWLVAYGYYLIAALGVFSRSAMSLFKRTKSLAMYFPQPTLMGYFLLPMIYFWFQFQVYTGIWHRWSEVVELFLYAGLVLWIVLLGRELVLRFCNSAIRKKSASYPV